MYFNAPAKKIKSRQNTKHYERISEQLSHLQTEQEAKITDRKKPEIKNPRQPVAFFYIFTENPYIYAIIGLSLIKPTDFFYENYFYPQLPGIGNHTDCFFSFSAESGRFIDFGKSPGIHRAG